MTDKRLCPGRTNGDWRIARECADCLRYVTRPNKQQLAEWIEPPIQQPCPRRIDR